MYLSPSVALFIILFAIIPCSFGTSGCDNFVRNLGRGYRRIVRCSHGNLTRVPQLERRSLRISELLLDDNRIARLTDRSFHTWSDIESLSVRNNRISRISVRAFRPLRRLQRLKLSGNQLHLPGGLSPLALAFVPEITDLDLSFNPLRELPPYHFQILGMLQKLHLRGVARPHLTISPNAFSGLKSLYMLDLTSNYLETLSEAAMGDQSESRRLKSILLGGANLWRCDCALRWLKKRHLQPPRRTKETEDLVAAVRPRCAEPVALRGRDLLAIDELQESDFQCVPKMESEQESQVTALTGGNVSLSCLVSADPLEGLEWFKERVRIQPSSLARPFVKSLSARDDKVEARLQLTEVTVEDSGRWSCVAWNGRGRVQSQFFVTVVQSCSARPLRVLGFTVMLAWGLLILAVAGLGLGWLNFRRKMKSKRLARLAKYTLVKDHQRPRSNVYLEEKL